MGQFVKPSLLKFFVKNVKYANFASKNTRLIRENYDMTNVVSIYDQSAVNYAVDLLKNGQLIALPTDTIYGIAADSQNPKAVESLYQLKGRNFDKPIAICVSRVDDIEHWGDIEGLPKGILNDLLPGPVTILLTRTSFLNQQLNPGNSKIGIRIPHSPFINKITKQFGSAIALTSANTSSEPSTLSPEEFEHLWPKLGAIFDGGKIGGDLESREGSTIVDVSENLKFKIIREGSALKETLAILHKYNLTR